MELVDYKIYRLVCNDLNIKDCYIGSTKNWFNRKAQHKNSISDLSIQNKKCQFIRETGGWCNWSMVLIEELKCENKRIAEKRERELIEQYGATLNSKLAFSEDYIKEWKERNPNYHKNWREKNPNYHKEWLEKNPDYVKNWMKKNKLY